jgi:lipoyl(octanoyl) transferase
MFEDRPLWCVPLGLVGYDEALALQKRLAAARMDGRIPDVLLGLEHPPTYTRGRRSTPAELPMGVDWYRAQGIDVRETDRGGRVTYHGPGQLVGYPIVSLRPLRDDVHAYIRAIEGLTGVWTAGGRKIGSIGIHVSHGVTTHGFAVNVANDLQPFQWIVPCGVEHCQVSSVTRELGRAADVGEFRGRVFAEVARALGRTMVDVNRDRLAELLVDDRVAAA